MSKLTSYCVRCYNLNHSSTHFFSFQQLQWIIRLDQCGIRLFGWGEESYNAANLTSFHTSLTHLTCLKMAFASSSFSSLLALSASNAIPDTSAMLECIICVPAPWMNAPRCLPTLPWMDADAMPGNIVQAQWIFNSKYSWESFSYTKRRNLNFYFISNSEPKLITCPMKLKLNYKRNGMCGAQWIRPWNHNQCIASCSPTPGNVLCS